MIAYKGFEKGLVCRGYQFEQGKTSKTDAANCAQNGFHAAENPLDTFSYYPDIRSSEYWMVRCSGDMHEDGVDSKISCTELTPIRRLTLPEMAAAALIYIQKHPSRYLHGNRNYYENKAFKLAKGENPILFGSFAQWLGFAEEKNGAVERINLIFIDNKRYKENIRYSIDGFPVGKEIL